MHWSDLNRNPSPRTLRQFAALCLVIFGGLALWQALGRGNSTAAMLWAALALGLGPVGLVWPQSLTWVYIGAMIATFPIGWVVSRVILALFFYVIITPVAAVFRLIGRDALRRRPRSELATYWLPKPAATDFRSYFRQS
jgi:hypothetical protein